MFSHLLTAVYDRFIASANSQRVIPRLVLAFRIRSFTFEISNMLVLLCYYLLLLTCNGKRIRGSLCNRLQLLPLPSKYNFSFCRRSRLRQAPSQCMVPPCNSVSRSDICTPNCFSDSSSQDISNNMRHTVPRACPLPHGHNLYICDNYSDSDPLSSRSTESHEIGPNILDTTDLSTPPFECEISMAKVKPFQL